MSALNKETRIVQNPALGAVLLWRFTRGYSEGSGISAPTPIPLLYVLLPIIYHQETAEFVKSTQKASGLRAFVHKFDETKTSKSDLILAIHDRAKTMRSLTRHSLSLAIASDLIAVDVRSGTVFPITKTQPKAGIPNSVSDMIKAAEKLGFWCSKLTLHEISITLKVAF
jgi:hypothetical protein